LSFTGKASSYHVGGDQAGAVGDHEDRLHALLAVLQRQTIIGIYTLAGGDEFVKNAVIAIPFGISQARWKMLDRSLWCMFSV